MFGGLYELIAYPKTWREYGLFLFGYPASVIFNIIVYLLTLEDIYGSSTWIFWIAGVMYAYALMHHKTLLKRKHGVLLIFLIGVVAGVFLCTIPWNFFGTDPLTNAAHVWGVLVGFLLALLIYGWGRGHMRHMLRLSVLKRVPY
jgi:membrane associated rhomboid family serine protease